MIIEIIIAIMILFIVILVIYRKYQMVNSTIMESDSE